MSAKSVNREEVLNNARRLVQEAVDVAHVAGIDASQVVAAHCAENSDTQIEDGGRSSNKLMWCCVPVIVDNDTCELFEMNKPDDDPQQEPTFLVTQSTANLVRQDFKRYKPSLERMVEDWQKDKKALAKKTDR